MLELTPRIFNIFMKPFEKLALHKRRKDIITKAAGNVLEIGAGTGVNFNYYVTYKISNLTVLDLKFNSLIKNHTLNNEIKIDYITGSAEQLPFEDNSFDSVVSTLVYCSVNDPAKALSEVYRVLKPGGKVYFIEHVLPEHKHYRNLVNSLNGAWNKIGKCNVNRETKKLIEEAMFQITDFESFGTGVLIFIKGIGVKPDTINPEVINN